MRCQQSHGRATNGIKTGHAHANIWANVQEYVHSLKIEQHCCCGRTHDAPCDLFFLYPAPKKKNASVKCITQTSSLMHFKVPSLSENAGIFLMLSDILQKQQLVKHKCQHRQFRSWRYVCIRRSSQYRCAPCPLQTALAYAD